MIPSLQPTIALLDTNIWVSGFIVSAGHPAKVIRLWREQKFVVIVSEALISEVSNVLSRPRIRKKFSFTNEAVDILISALRQHGKMIKTTGNLKLCRDPKDDFILETAILGGAKYVVSRDEDITRDAELRIHLADFGITPITVQHFLDLFMNPQPDVSI